MDNSFLMCVLDGMADLDEQVESSCGVQLFVVTVFGDRNPLDQFHHKIWPACIRAPGIEHAGDVGMIHHRQRLPFRFEARDHLRAIHPRLDNFECDAPADGLLLLGHVDYAHSPFTDLLEELVTADERAGPFGNRREWSGAAAFIEQMPHRRRRSGYGFQEAPGFGPGQQKGLNPGAQLRIVRTGSVEILPPRQRIGNPGCFGKNALNVHARTPSTPSCADNDRCTPLQIRNFNQFLSADVIS